MLDGRWEGQGFGPSVGGRGQQGIKRGLINGSGKAVLSDWNIIVRDVMAEERCIGFWLRNVMMLRSTINITHIPEEQVAYRQCTRLSLPLAKAWLCETSLTPLSKSVSLIQIRMRNTLINSTHAYLCTYGAGRALSTDVAWNTSNPYWQFPRSAWSWRIVLEGWMAGSALPQTKHIPMLLSCILLYS